jgi:hypothetical protein
MSLTDGLDVAGRSVTASYGNAEDLEICTR